MDKVTTYDFSTGNTNPATFPIDAFAEAAARAIRADSGELNRYPGSFGHEGLRRLIAQREFDREGVRRQLESIALTNGSMQAISLIADALRSGQDDTVILEEYSYGGSLGAFRSKGLRLIGIPLDQQGMRADALGEALERLARQGHRPSFIYVQPTYQNPTGIVMPRQRRLEIIRLAKAYNCVLVEDNCYADVTFDGKPPPAFYALTDYPKQIYLCSLSKIFAPGIRIGYLMANPPLLQRILDVRHDAGPNGLAAAAAEAFLRDRLWQHVETANSALRRKRDAMMAALETHLGNSCSFACPAGGLFVWVRLPEEIDQSRFQSLAAARQVAFIPGSEFHIDGQDIPYLRLAFGYPTVKEIEAGVAVLGACLRDASEGCEEPS